MSFTLEEVVFKYLSLAEKDNSLIKTEERSALLKILLELCEGSCTTDDDAEIQKNEENAVTVAKSLGFCSMDSDLSSLIDSDALRFLAAEAIVSDKLKADDDTTHFAIDEGAENINEENDKRENFQELEAEMEKKLCSIRDIFIEDYKKHSDAQKLNLKLLAQAFAYNVQNFTATTPNPYGEEILNCASRLEESNEWNLEAILGSGSKSSENSSEQKNDHEPIKSDLSLSINPPSKVSQEVINDLLEPSTCSSGRCVDQIPKQISQDSKPNPNTTSSAEDGRFVSNNRIGNDSMLEARRSSKISGMPRWHK